MKKLLLSVLLIVGLAAINHGKPVNEIYSINDPMIIEEETYVDDIPFDTYEIALNVIIEDHSLKMTEEAYIDDIPFNTRKIADRYKFRKMEEKSFESNVNDIPFNTEKLMYEELASRLTDIYRDEENTQDLPEARLLINSSDEKRTARQKRPGIQYYQPIIYPVRLCAPKMDPKNELIDEPMINFPSSSL